LWVRHLLLQFSSWFCSFPRCLDGPMWSSSFLLWSFWSCPSIVVQNNFPQITCPVHLNGRYCKLSSFYHLIWHLHGHLTSLSDCLSSLFFSNK
jgi:hypothetical protein